MAVSPTDARPAPIASDAFWFELPEPAGAVQPPDALDPPEPPEFRVERLVEPERVAEATTEAEPVAAEPEPKPAPVPARGWTDPWGFDLSELTDARRRRRRRARQREREREREGRPAAEGPAAVESRSGPRTPAAWALASRRRRQLAVLAVGAGLAGVATGAGHSQRAARGVRSQPPVARTIALPTPSVFAQRSVPPTYLRLYVHAAAEYGLDWSMLAAVGQTESGSGGSQLPGVSAGTNHAGAAGPAQFESATWQRFGVDTDGRGQSDPYDPADAITSMAAYLKASGAPQDWRTALFAYNHSERYVDAVLALSRQLVDSGASPA